jgi:ribonuclease HII
MLQPFMHAHLLEAGCDEAGRGCLAGPVVAAAVILDPENPIAGLNDSKKLSETRRNALAAEIRNKALAWHVAECSPAEIDDLNILWASIEAMHRAVNALQTVPQHLLIDGNRFRPHTIPHTCVVKGDGKFQSIAAASILAKTHRDMLMQQLAESFPHYGWHRNKGYPTSDHRQAIVQHGLCEHHRKSFRALPDQLALF